MCVVVSSQLTKRVGLLQDELESPAARRKKKKVCLTYTNAVGEPGTVILTCVGWI